MSKYPVKVVPQDHLQHIRRWTTAAESIPTEPTDAVVELVRAVNESKKSALWQYTPPHTREAVSDALDRLRTACPELVEMAEKEPK